MVRTYAVVGGSCARRRRHGTKLEVTSHIHRSREQMHASVRRGASWFSRLVAGLRRHDSHPPPPPTRSLHRPRSGMRPCMRATPAPAASHPACRFARRVVNAPPAQPSDRSFLACGAA